MEGRCNAEASDAQHIGERFAQLYYGLLAVKPSALRQFYFEESLMSRTCGHSSESFRGADEIMTSIMASVGGKDPDVGGPPLVVTQVDSVQSRALADSSAVMAQITGCITFLMEQNITKFSQSVVLEPRLSSGRRALLVRNDIVQYSPGSIPALQPPGRCSTSWAAIAASASSPGKAKSASPVVPVASKALSSSGRSAANLPHPPLREAPLPPEPSWAPSASSSAGGGGGSAADDGREPVKLWVSGIPVEDGQGRPTPVKGAEVRDVLNKCLREHAPHISGEVMEVDRKDERKPFAFALLGEERAAKELVLLSKQKKVVLRGERLHLDLSNYNKASVDTLYTGSAARSHWHENSGAGGRGKGKRDDGDRWTERRSDGSGSKGWRAR